MIESLLLTVTRVTTMLAEKQLTNATGLFFERDGRLFLVTNRHVVLDEPSNHRPDKLLIELHTNRENIAETTQFSVPLYRDGKSIWRQGSDSGGVIDVAAVELNRAAMPKTVFLQAFTPAHLVTQLDEIEVGASVVIVGFPLGFHDTLHHLPVARQAIIASSFGIRFQGKGYFLTAAVMHRGTSGSPVVVRITNLSGRGKLAWALAGIHSARLDVNNRDETQDDRLNLNCAWYPDILLTITAN